MLQNPDGVTEERFTPDGAVQSGQPCPGAQLDLHGQGVRRGEAKVVRRLDTDAGTLYRVGEVLQQGRIGHCLHVRPRLAMVGAGGHHVAYDGAAGPATSMSPKSQLSSRASAG